MNWRLLFFVFAVLTVALGVNGDVIEPSTQPSNVSPGILEAFNKFTAAVAANPSNFLSLFLKFLKNFNNSIAEATTAFPSILNDFRHILD